jgi:hypothetical protein
MITCFQCRSATDPQAPLIPIPIILIVAITAIAFITVCATVLRLCSNRQSPVDAYTLRTFPPVIGATVQPHSAPHGMAPALLPSYDSLQVGDPLQVGGSLQVGDSLQVGNGGAAHSMPMTSSV